MRDERILDSDQVLYQRLQCPSPMQWTAPFNGIVMCQSCDLHNCEEPGAIDLRQSCRAGFPCFTEPALLFGDVRRARLRCFCIWCVSTHDAVHGQFAKYANTKPKTVRWRRFISPVDTSCGRCAGGFRRDCRRSQTSPLTALASGTGRRAQSFLWTALGKSVRPAVSFGHRASTKGLRLFVKIFPFQNVISQHFEVLFRFRPEKWIFSLENLGIHIVQVCLTQQLVSQG